MIDDEKYKLFWVAILDLNNVSLLVVHAFSVSALPAATRDLEQGFRFVVPFGGCKLRTTVERCAPSLRRPRLPG